MVGDAKKSDDIHLMLMSRPKAGEGESAGPYVPVYDASATVTTMRTSTPTTGDDSSPVASLLMVAAFGLIAAGMRRRHSL